MNLKNRGFEDSELIEATQTISIPCAEYVLENRNKVDYIEIASNRHKRCSNRITRSGEHTGVLPPEDLTLYKEKDGTEWCFTYGDLEEIKLNGENPYTGTPISKDDLDNLTIKIPRRYVPLNIKLNQVYNNDMCPLFHSLVPNQGYVMLPHSDDPLILKEFYEYHVFDVKRYIDPISIVTGDIYRVTFDPAIRLSDEPAASVLITTRYINSMVRIYDSSEDESDYTPYQKKALLPRKIEYELDRYYKNGVLSGIVEEYFKKYRMPLEALVVLKGLNFDESIKDSSYVVKDEIDIKFDKFSSWTTNSCVSIAEAMKHKYGAVVSTEVSPDEILVDLRTTNYKHQNIILFPGVYKTQIKTITYPYAPFTVQRPLVRDTNPTDSEKIDLSQQDISQRVTSIIRMIMVK